MLAPFAAAGRNVAFRRPIPQLAKNRLGVRLTIGTEFMRA
jgi:hypothetical protein